MTKGSVMEDVQWLNASEEVAWREWISLISKFPTVLNRQLMEDSDLTLPDYEVLVRLSEDAQGRMRVVALAEAMSWERSRLSHQVARMAKRGLVEKRLCSEDGRGAWVHISAAGRAAIEKAAPGHVQAVRELFFDEIDDDELEVFGSVLRKISTRVNERLSG
ncbi:MarR family winged helix-turn-helix transcriptional regulator [Micrococcoides hystricis]|uniref:MarR family winged helix-turn-helix transcriptional regulator n=1 Tax=Micrococcoides hystricis TaxID=1572761 RepID=A0ABV6PAA3_9MICC